MVKGVREGKREEVDVRKFIRQVTPIFVEL
jgi:hypothetical protein